MADNGLEKAIGLIQAGKLDAARAQLELIIKNDRSNIPAWHWYVQTWPGAKEKARIWQACLRYNPGNLEAQQALKDLHFSLPQPVTPETKAPQVKAPMADVPRKRTGSMLWLVWMSLGLLAFVGLFALILAYNPQPKDPQQYRHVQPFEYYLYAPKAYSADKEWPLFIGIHGAGGNGLQCWQLFQAYAEREGFILLCPSIPGDPGGFYQDVGETAVWSSIEQVQKEYRIRPRMFLSGFSAGAAFIQGFTYHYSQSVSGLAILSSGMYMDPRVFPELIPILVVIGDSDNATAVQSSRVFVDGLKSYGFDVQYQVLPGVGHTVTREGVNSTMELFRKTIGK